MLAWSIHKSFSFILFLVVLASLPVGGLRSEAQSPELLSLSDGRSNMASNMALSTNWQTAFQDDFNSGDDNGWTRERPNDWSVQNGEYSLSISGYDITSKSWAGSASWMNYAVEFSVENLSCVDDQVYIRGGTYIIQLRHGTSYGAPDVRLWGTGGLLVDQYYRLDRNVWYRVRVEVVEQRIKVWIDGNLVIDYFDGMASPNPGRIALGGWTGACGNLAAHFDDVTVAVAPTELTTIPTSIPADDISVAVITLSNAPITHQIHFLSSLTGSVFSHPKGTVNASGQLTTTIRSSTPGTAIITAQDLTTGEASPASASVTFTPVEGQPPSPPSQVGDIVITDVRAQRPLDARYLQGIPVPNRIDVTVDWKGTTSGRVDFILNGATFSQTTNGSTASHTFDMGADLQAGSNSLRIVAVNAAGQSSQPQDFAPYSVPSPAWLTGLQAVGAIAPMVMGGSVHAGYEYEANVKFPPGGISLGAPGFGPPGSTTELSFFVGGGLSLPLVCNSPIQITGQAGAEAKIDLLGVELGGELKGSGNLEGRAVQCEIPTVNGSFRVDIKVYGQKNWPVLVFVVNFIAPGVGDTLQAVLPYEVLTLLGEVYLQGNLSGFFSSGVQVIPESPYLEWQGVSVGGGPGVETGYQFEKLGVKFKVYLGAAGSIELTNPNPLRDLTDLRFDHVTLRGEAGYTVQVFWWEESEKLYVEWRYPAGMARSAALTNAHRPAWKLIGHTSTKDYATFRAQPDKRQAFARTAVEIEPLALSATTAVTSVLVSNVYTYPEPSLVVQPVTGDALLLWVHDDVAKPVGQAQEIEFSRWDGSAWSVPAGVTDDDRLDGAPQVTWAAGGEGVAVWQRLNETLPITATFDVTTAQKIEIATAVYSPTLGTWSPVSLLTNNAALDMTPHLAANAAGKLLAAWRQNDAGLLSGTVTDTDRIVTGFYDGGWGTAAVAVDAIPGLVDLAAGYGTDAATVAFTRYLTPTGSITPTLQLFTAAWDGSAWAAPVQRTDDDLGHRSPQVVYDAANELLVVWLAGTGQGQALSLRNLVTAAVVTLTLPAEIGALDEFRVLQDAAGNLAAVFTAQAGQRDLFVAFFDQAHGLWGSPVRLTDDRASEAYPAPGLDPTGRLLMGYAATAITPITHTTTISETGEVITYTLPTEGQTDLLTLSHAFTRNLTLTDSDFAVSDDHPAPGATVVLSATVHNSGDLALDGVAASFYDGDLDAGGTLIATQVWPAPLAAGFTATLTTTYAAPTTGGVRDLYAVADPAHAIAEANEADNTAHLAAFGPDLELASAGTEAWGGSDVGLVTVIRNLGTTASQTTTVAFYGEDAVVIARSVFCDEAIPSNGKDCFGAAAPRNDGVAGIGKTTVAPLITDTIPMLAAGAMFTLTTPWNYGALPEGSYSLTATVNPGSANFTEVVTANNTSSLALPVRPDLSVNPLYVWAVPLPDGTMVVTAAVSNFGSIAAPAATVDIYVDAVFSDTARLRTLTLPAIAPASQVYVTATWGSPTAGEHTFYVLVNADRSVAELTWVNNVASAWGAGPLTDLAAAKEAGGARLTWTHGGRSVTRYEVYRSTNPYFTPGGADAQKLNDVPPPAAGNTVNYTDAGAFSSPTGAYFYAVVTVDRAGLMYPPSNRVGAFSFGLTPGAP